MGKSAKAMRHLVMWENTPLGVEKQGVFFIYL